MEVEVIVYDQETKVIEEPVQQYKPDHEFPWKEEDANAPNENNYQKMKLLNYKNCHFNLIVKEDQPLITSSSDTNNLESTTQNTTSVKIVESKMKTEINVTKDVLCKKCETTFKNNNEVNNHMKNVHKDEYIKVLETKLKESEKEKEVAKHAKKDSEEEVHRLTENLEKVKIENKELRTLKNKNTFTVKKTPGDMYDRQDEEEFDSEKEVLHGKHKGFRRNGPQVQPT